LMQFRNINVRTMHTLLTQKHLLDSITTVVVAVASLSFILH
jgi:hypothetical protein